jgi:nucleoside 2-deoxyribosyltransferase
LLDVSPPSSTIAQPTPSRVVDRPTLVLYLAGAITGLSYGEAVAWREETANRLAETAPHVRCVDPTRAKRHLANVDQIGPHGHPGGLLDGHAVVARDLWDLDRADVILMNLSGARRASVGCMVELGWARARGRFVIVVLPAEETAGAPRSADMPVNPHDHSFVHELASAVVGTLDEALALIETM